MTDFDYECWQKKILARQASHKKNGSKSKKCSFPSDYLTKKQIKERNGAIVSINLDEPMKWEIFTALSPKTQSEYLKHIIQKYGATQTNIANMFGIAQSSFWRYCKTNDIDIKFSKGHRRSKEEQQAWDEFLTKFGIVPKASKLVDSKPIDAETTTVASNVPVESNVELIKESLSSDEDIKSDTAQISAMKMNTVSLSFSGKIDINQITNSLRLILGNSATGQLNITFTMD